MWSFWLGLLIGWLCLPGLMLLWHGHSFHHNMALVVLTQCEQAAADTVVGTCMGLRGRVVLKRISELVAVGITAWTHDRRILLKETRHLLLLLRWCRHRTHWHTMRDGRCTCILISQVLLLLPLLMTLSHFLFIFKRCTFLSLCPRIHYRWLSSTLWFLWFFHLYICDLLSNG